nr:putative F-box protein At3g10240 [Aegilops tauschii subsp. strangulata]
MARGSRKKKRDTRRMARGRVSDLPDDLLVEILSRLPYKSTRCCKCVSTRWRDLISHPDHRKKLSQSTLAGFFFETWDTKKVSRRYQSVSGNWHPPINSSLSFLPRCEKLRILDCCNGLLLCKCWQDTDRKILDYVVCNPATEKWVVVPATNWSSQLYKARLGFDPVVSSHFHVFEFVPSVPFGSPQPLTHSSCPQNDS